MPSVVSHAIAGLAIGYAGSPRGRAAGYALAGAACAVLPDIDAVTFWIGRNHHEWGAFSHRGITHSLLFALLLGAGAAALFFRKSGFWRASLCLALAAASHGVLDALTNGGSGVAFLAPFDSTRYFFPVRPIRVSPIRPRAFLSVRGWLVLRNEMLWIWIPSAVLVAIRRWKAVAARG